MTEKIVDVSPLTHLSDNEGFRIEATRVKDFSQDEASKIIADSDLIIADVGHPLRWLQNEEKFNFWKSEVKPHLYNPSKRYLEEYRGEYFYFAFLWVSGSRKIIQLQKVH